MTFNREHPNVQGFLRAFEEVTGKPISYTDSYGGTDARHYTPEGIPCIVVGPYGGGRHANEEWILADDLKRYYELLAQWLGVRKESTSFADTLGIAAN